MDPYVQYPAYAKVREGERERRGRWRERVRGRQIQLFLLQFAKLENLITEPSFEIANIMFTMCKGTLLMIAAVQSLRLP